MFADERSYAKCKDQRRVKDGEFKSRRNQRENCGCVNECVCACVYLHIYRVMGRVASELIYKQFTEFEKIRNEKRGTHRLWEQHPQNSNVRKAGGEIRVQNIRFNLR